jgi:hypothetical protein
LEGTKMEIRIATEREIKTLAYEHKRGRSKSPIRLRIEAIEDETIVFDGCCDGGIISKCLVTRTIRSAIANTQVASPEKKFKHSHVNGAVFVWRRKEETDG